MQTGRVAITHRRVLRIALPIMVSSATIPMLGAVDTAVVGQLGLAAPIGAVGLGAVILASIYWIFGFLRMGTTGLVAQARGAREAAATGALLLRGLMIAAAAGAAGRRGRGGGGRRPPPARPDDGRGPGHGLRPAAGPVLLGGVPPRPRLARGRGDGAHLPRHPHLGGAGGDRLLCARRLADRAR